ncbi:MAG: hypothetical protein LBC96_00010 [Lachnospiraceae bacterium]|jgi:hypothetical protein|nr:hypothetical protein [Lachnospiraceae bacterium]
MKTKMIILIIAFISHSACTTVYDAQNYISQIEENNEVTEMIILAQWVYYENHDKLLQRASHVIRVIVLDDGRSEMVNTRTYKPDNPDWKPRYDLYTLHNVEAIESFSGDLVKGDTIDIGQVGGETSELRVMNKDRIQFKVGDDIVLFIYMHEYMTYAELLSPMCAVYHIETENGTRISSDTRASDDHKLVPVYERGRLSFTIGELRNYCTKEE